MRNVKKLVISLWVSLLIFLPGAVAKASPTGGYGPNGPNTALGMYEFLGCHFFYNAEFAAANSNLGQLVNAQHNAEFNNITLAVGFLYDAYTNGGDLTHDGYAYAYAYGLDQNVTYGQPLNTTYEQLGNTICTNWTNGIPGNPNAYVNIANTDGRPGPNLPERWNGCKTSITIDMDATLENLGINLYAQALSLSALTGYNVVYQQGLGPAADIWIHDGYTDTGAIGQTYTTVDSNNPQELTHGESVIETTQIEALSGEYPTLLQTVVNHELGLAIGMGEPAMNGIDVMDTATNPTVAEWYQAGDWNSGTYNGILYAPCFG